MDLQSDNAQTDHSHPLPGGWRAYTYEKLASTMDKAHELARQGCGHGTVVLAKEQTAGRGRHGNSWEALPGNLNASVVLVPQTFCAQNFILSYMVCVAAGHALLSFLPNKNLISYKWPNDILLCEKKLAGILLEADCDDSASPKRSWVASGLGLNFQSFPAQARWPATSLRQEGFSINAEEFLAVFVCELQSLFALSQSEGFLTIRQMWLQRAWGIGRTIFLDEENGEKRSGILETIDMEGRLVLRGPDGNAFYCTTGRLSI